MQYSPQKSTSRPQVLKPEFASGPLPGIGDDPDIMWPMAHFFGHPILSLLCGMADTKNVRVHPAPHSWVADQGLSLYRPR